MIEKLHLLSEYIDVLKENDLIEEMNLSEETLNKKVNYVSYNSQDIKYDTLFICKGAHFNVKYLLSALEEGAFAYISEVKYEEAADAEYILVKDMRKTMAYLADIFYNQIWKRISIAGITGTKGKSTTTYFMRHILDEYLKAEKKPVSAVLSGIDNYDGVINEESHLTTPETLELHKHFYNAVNSGIEFVSMEVSSQALKYHRTMGITFDVGCFLIVGLDHISDVEHPTFDDYLQAKMVIFGQCKNACINLESEYAQMAIDAATGKAERIITFGMKPEADIYGYDTKPVKKGISFRVKCDSFDEEFRIGMTGLFNVDNALAAIATSYALNIP